MNPEGKTNRRKIQQITNIISHEVSSGIFSLLSVNIFKTLHLQLVHMFFGNLVTCDYWDYVWLNEGFASYLEYVIADKVKQKLPLQTATELINLKTDSPPLANIGTFCCASIARCNASGCRSEYPCDDTTHQLAR